MDRLLCVFIRNLRLLLMSMWCRCVLCDLVKLGLCVFIVWFLWWCVELGEGCFVLCG